MRRRAWLTGTSALGLSACRRTSRGAAPSAIPPPGPTAPVRVPTDAPARAPSRSGPTPFAHGIASGDPLPDRVILWTRVTAPTSATEVETRWAIATDPAMRTVVGHGSVTANAALDHTVKIDATGLTADRVYYYRFEALGHRSPIGRTRTLPVDAPQRLRLAVVSCSNYPFGYFNAYAAIARRPDLHAVLHLGDYLYEYENGRYGDGTRFDRIPRPADREIVTLADYRDRHAVYKTDPDLQAMHQQHPMIAIWDDHESANDSWRHGAQNHQPEDGDWMVRKAAAIAAYYEWMPIRSLPAVPPQQHYRRLRYGDLLDLVMLDTRLHGRDHQADWRKPGYEAVIADPRRTLLGLDQEAWLGEQLRRSKAEGVAWRILGQQVLMARLRPRALGDWVNTDMWDGYAPARERVFDLLRGEKIDDVVVLTGDIHSSWGTELLPASRRGRGRDTALAVEAVTPAVSSPPPVRSEDALEREASVTASHPHVRWLELRHRGHVLLDIDRERTVAEWHLVDDIETRSPETRFARGLAVSRGRARWDDVAEPTTAPADVAEPAPTEPT